MASMFTISDDVREVLAAAVIDERTVKLTQQLDRKLYLGVNKVLAASGGKWNREAPQRHPPRSEHAGRRQGSDRPAPRHEARVTEPGGQRTAARQPLSRRSSPAVAPTGSGR
jgi:hypothetical protein